MRFILKLTSFSAGLVSDLYEFDTISQSWTDITDVALGNPPSPREFEGFTSIGRILYVYGGTAQHGTLLGISSDCV